MVSLLLLVAAIGGGARLLAGEEEQGTLDLLLSLVALCLELVGLGAVLLLALAYGALALLVGAATGRRARAIAVASGLAVAAYLVNALAPLVHALDTVRPASPWYHYAVSDSLRSGLELGHTLVLVGVVVVVGALVPLVFGRRDLA